MTNVVRFSAATPGPSLRDQLRRSLAHLDATELERAARLAILKADRAALEAETQDPYCYKTARDIHYADEDLADWDRAHGSELDALIEELGA